MKKVFKTFFFTVFSLLYLFVMSYYSSIAFIGSLDGSKLVEADSEQFHPLIFPGALGHTDKTEALTVVLNNVPTADFKNLSKQLTPFIRAVENRLFNYFSQYSFYSKHLSISARHTTLIYPFHYFW